MVDLKADDEHLYQWLRTRINLTNVLNEQIESKDKESFRDRVVIKVRDLMLSESLEIIEQLQHRHVKNEK